MKPSDIIFTAVIFGLCTGFVLYHYLRYRREIGRHGKHSREGKH